MKAIILIILIQFCSIYAFSQKLKLNPYYDYQFAFETGFGGAGEKNVPFLFGIQAGTFYRISNHQFGARIADFSRGLFYNRDECMTINLFYGFMFVSKNVSIAPQLGGGYFRTYDGPRNNWHKYNLEATLELAFTKMGNGIYLRTFYIWNPNHNYLGITVGGRFGYVWMKK